VQRVEQGRGRVGRLLSGRVENDPNRRASQLVGLGYGAGRDSKLLGRRQAAKFVARDQRRLTFGSAADAVG
jgi:hypothetical protein